MPVISWDLCDLIYRLRSHIFFKDRDVCLATGRKLYLADGTEVPSSALVPVGGIILWSGAIANIPANWQLCDGSNSTPDLRDRFVVGAGNTYAVDASGGADSIDIQHNHGGATGAGTAHTHASGSYATDSDSHSHGPGTLATDSDSHYHTLVHTPATGYVQTGMDQDYALYTDSDNHSHDVDSGTTAGDSHSHDVTGTSGSESAHTHSISNALSTTQSVLNPYYALAYIQRLS